LRPVSGPVTLSDSDAWLGLLPAFGNAPPQTLRSMSDFP
jgi:hypothetical protein